MTTQKEREELLEAARRLESDPQWALARIKRIRSRACRRGDTETIGFTELLLTLAAGVVSPERTLRPWAQKLQSIDNALIDSEKAPTRAEGTKTDEACSVCGNHSDTLHVRAADITLCARCVEAWALAVESSSELLQDVYGFALVELPEVWLSALPVGHETEALLTLATECHSHGWLAFRVKLAARAIAHGLTRRGSPTFCDDLRRAAALLDVAGCNVKALKEMLRKNHA